MLNLATVATDLFFSLYRVLAGLLLATFLSLLLSWIRFSLPKSVRGNILVKFCFEAPKFPPPIAWIPLIVLLAGIGEISAILIVAIGALPPLFTTLFDGLDKFPTRYLDTANSYELKGLERFKIIYLRALMPNFFTGLKSAAGMGWMSVIAAEMVSGESGLGYGIGLARIYLRYDYILIYMVLMALTGQTIFYLIDRLRLFSITWETR